MSPSSHDTHVSQQSLKRLREAIPTHCFQPSLATSCTYLLRDILYACSLIYASTFIAYLPPGPLRFAAWTAYTFIQGCVGTGLWILAHECGHGAFSPYQRVNDFIGWVLHSILLVPYFSWKFTHARHHRFTAHLTKDSVFVPLTASELMETYRVDSAERVLDLVEETPLATMISGLVGYLLLGFQWYLVSAKTSGKEAAACSSEDEQKQEGQEGQTLSHFNPASPLFYAPQREFVVLSDAGLLATLGLLVYCGSRLGAGQVGLLYVVPYLWVHHWIVAITFLHHTDPSVPYYSPSTWTYTKGALSTVDRSFGFMGRHFFHEIIDFHVVHHLFPRIPFYRAEDATRAIRPLLGDQYHETKSERFLGTFLSRFRSCWCVGEEVNEEKGAGTGVFWWMVKDDNTRV